MPRAHTRACLPQNPHRKVEAILANAEAQTSAEEDVASLHSLTTASVHESEKDASSLASGGGDKDDDKDGDKDDVRDGDEDGDKDGDGDQDGDMDGDKHGDKDSDVGLGQRLRVRARRLRAALITRLGEKRLLREVLEHHISHSSTPSHLHTAPHSCSCLRLTISATFHIFLHIAPQHSARSCTGIATTNPRPRSSPTTLNAGS